MQFRCTKCNQSYKPNKDGELACACEKMPKDLDKRIARTWLIHFFGIDINQLREEVKADA